MNPDETTNSSVVDPTSVTIKTLQEAIKGDGSNLSDERLLEVQARLFQECLVPVEYTKSYGTCVDERRRAHLLSGEQSFLARPSVPGGPVIYGLLVHELTGFVFPNDCLTGESRLAFVKKRQQDAQLLGGGHLNCAANARLPELLSLIGKGPAGLRDYTKQHLGDNFSDDALQAVVQYAQAALSTEVYSQWNEQLLVTVHGDEAGTAIEVLDDIPHGALTVGRNGLAGFTIDQNTLYEVSILGKGSYDMDEVYAGLLETVAASGPDAGWKSVLARHARELILAAVVQVVPNPDLYEVQVLPAST